MRRPLGAVRLLLTLAVALVVVAACGDDHGPGATTTAPGAGQPALEGTRWAQVDGPARLLLVKGQYTSTVGCNTISGAYTTSGSSLTFTPGPATLKACPGEQAATEAAWIADLGAVASYRIAGGRLELRDASGRTLRTFAPEVDVPLAGTWTLDGLVTAPGQGISVAAGDERIQLTFAADGTLTGSDGCNQLNGTYTTGAAGADGRTPLTYGPLASTRKACDAAIMERATAFQGALARVASYAIEGTRLTQYDSGGNVVVRFRRA